MLVDIILACAPIVLVVPVVVTFLAAHVNYASKCPHLNRDHDGVGCE
jgi:hypothetical protein